MRFDRAARPLSNQRAPQLPAPGGAPDSCGAAWPRRARAVRKLLEGKTGLNHKLERRLLTVKSYAAIQAAGVGQVRERTAVPLASNRRPTPRSVCGDRAACRPA